MQLKDWILIESGLSYKTAVKVLGIPYQKLWNICNGRTNISLIDAIDIEKKTKHKVRIKDWLEQAKDKK